MKRRVQFGTREMDARLVGVTPEYADMMKMEIDRGHFISAAEMAREANRTPPWYTAFWYAFGLFTKSLL